MYICPICKTPTVSPKHCDLCGWIQAITIPVTGETVNLNVSVKYNNVPTKTEGIVFITEDTQHITGGRYYSWWLATALMHAGHKVTIVTNRKPPFLDSFKYYKQPFMYVVPSLEVLDIEADIYVGSPVIGSLKAIQLAKKYGKQAYCEIFDPFPMMEKYRGNHNWPGWGELLPALREKHVKIISLCKEANKYIYEWLEKPVEDVYEIYPCINSRAKDKVKELKKKNWVTFV